MNLTQLATAALVGGRSAGARAAWRAPLRACGAARRGFSTTAVRLGRGGGNNNGGSDLEKKLASLKNDLNDKLQGSSAYYSAKSKVDELWRTIDLKLAQYGISTGDSSGTDLNLLRYFLSAMLILYVMYFVSPPGVKAFFANHFMLTTVNYTRLYPFLTSLVMCTDFFSMLISCLIIYSVAPPLLFTLGRQRFWQVFIGGGMVSNLLFVMLEGSRNQGWMRHVSMQSGPSACCTSLIAMSCLLRPQQTVMLFFIPVQSLHLAYLILGVDALRLFSAFGGGRAEHVGGAFFGAGYWYFVLGQQTAL